MSQHKVWGATSIGAILCEGNSFLVTPQKDSGLCHDAVAGPHHITHSYPSTRCGELAFDASKTIHDTRTWLECTEQGAM